MTAPNPTQTPPRDGDQPGEAAERQRNRELAATIRQHLASERFLPHYVRKGLELSATDLEGM